ncbi:MAG: ANL family adenylate-forming protein [Gemmatimonadaceae bacterium]
MANSHIDWQLLRFREAPDRTAIVWNDREFHYGDLETLYESWLDRLTEAGVAPGCVVTVAGDYSPASITCLLALVRLNCVLVPLSRESRDQHGEFLQIAETDFAVDIAGDDSTEIRRLAFRRKHDLLERLRSRQQAGLVLFSSGSTGKPKAILHALPPILEKFRKPRHCYRTISFLLFDHIGGFNTLFYTLGNLGCIVAPADRSVAKVCRAVERHGAELLPTSPSFLNLMLMARAHEEFDLASLKLITYGTEVMPERTLRAVTEALPNVTLQQTYGLSELGILRSKSASNQSLMVKVGGEDYETKIVNGTLRIRARCSMLGYLNAPSPFDAEGWFDTGDAVIQEGEYLRILGRHSEIVNVGGQKVYPAEVEKVIAEMPNVVDVAVSGEAHLLLGQVVVAVVQLSEQVPDLEFKRRIAEHCKGRLQPYMVPTKVRVVTGSLVNERFKKIRRQDAPATSAKVASA